MRLAAAAVALFLLQGAYDHASEVDATPDRFQFQRALQPPAGAQGQACAVLDAAVFAHSAGRVNDLRIYSAGREVPFAQTTSGELGQQEEPARVMNLGRQEKAIVFDLVMPQRAYTEVVLDLDGKDFYATAKVSGSQTDGGSRTDLGQFTLFDLRSQRLSRSTVLALQESNFPLLHVEMIVTPAPGGEAKTLSPEMVHGATVPPSREAQTLFTTVAATTGIVTKGDESVASFNVPAHVPVERVSFTLQPEFTKNFSRAVRVTARSSQTEDSAATETIPGEIQHVLLPLDALGHQVHSEQMSMEALVAENLRSDATIDVAIENGDEAPLPLRAVLLQMKQRKICFDAEPGASYVLRYGDAEPVYTPVYDYARLFRVSATAATVTMGAETLNPDFRKEPQQQSYKDRHPELLWVALLLVIGVLGTIALHNARRVGRTK
ncbi:MAG TPA: DUF3999 family protein [Acidobacteriaceae bacterium]|nr:DUF3999 family protein [Acidobacteriaceae bacterium]